MRFQLINAKFVLKVNGSECVLIEQTKQKAIDHWEKKND